MKKALVLAGGGSRGAYQAGCIKALNELGHTFDIVTGTSIGALNGLLVVQQDFDKLYNLWETITINDVMKDPINFNFSVDSLLSQANLIIPFFKSYLNDKGADITPLINLVTTLYNPNKFFSSNTDYGVVTIKYPSLNPIEPTKNKMQGDDPLHFALASAACFPAFPIYNFNNQSYIDGGYYDGLPISLALQLGATEIIAIELGVEPAHDYFVNRPNIILIRPYHELGGFLDFSRSLLDERMQLGYFDTLKTFKVLKGYQYTFENNEISLEKQQNLYNLILRYENKANRSIFNKKNDDTPITSTLLSMTHQTFLSLEDYTILSLETTLIVYDYSYTKLYDFNKISLELYNNFIKNYKKNNTISKRGTSLKKMSSINAINHFYYCLQNNIKIDILSIDKLLIKELIVALYFYTFKNN